MADLASVDDLEVLMQRAFSGSDFDQAEMVLSSVSAWARAVSGQSWPEITGVPSDVKYVVLAAARRTLRNPDGVTAESMGPFSKTYDKPPANFFTPAELSILKRYRPKANSGLFTIGFTRGEKQNPRFAAAHLFWHRDDDWLMNGDPFACVWPSDLEYEEYEPLD